jgi:hypothetical protein
VVVWLTHVRTIYSCLLQDPSTDAQPWVTRVLDGWSGYGGSGVVEWVVPFVLSLMGSSRVAKVSTLLLSSLAGRTVAT